MNAWNASEGGPCFFRPAGVYCPDKNPEAEKTQAPCFDLDEQGNYNITPGREACCKSAMIDERGVQHNGCPMSSLTNFHGQCMQSEQRISFVLNLEYGFYHNISVDEQHRPRGCKVLKQNMYVLFIAPCFHP